MKTQFVTVVIAGLWTVCAASAQEISAGITGRVTDPSGGSNCWRFGVCERS